MKTSHRIIAALIGLGVTAGVAQAQPVDQRHHEQQTRIDNGVRTGALTPGEAHRVEHQQRSIRHQEARMRYRNGGHLNGYQRARLEHREDRASHHIYRAKHNGRSW